jgi:GNAT superfamily N-acetyltransferase
MYVVMPEYQGNGVGTRLFDAMLELCAPRKFLYGGNLLKLVKYPILDSICNDA